MSKNSWPYVRITSKKLNITGYYLKIASYRWLQENNRLLFPITAIDDQGLNISTTIEAYHNFLVKLGFGLERAKCNFYITRFFFHVQSCSFDELFLNKWRIDKQTTILSSPPLLVRMSTWRIVFPIANEVSIGKKAASESFLQ